MSSLLTGQSINKVIKASHVCRLRRIAVHGLYPAVYSPCPEMSLLSAPKNIYIMSVRGPLYVIK